MEAPEHGNQHIYNSPVTEDGESAQELYENIEKMDKEAQDEQVTTKNSLVSISHGLVSIFPYAATAFVQQLTMNDRPDIDFVSLLLSYLLQLGLLFLLKKYIVNHSESVKRVIALDLYDVLMDVFTFGVILYSIILIKLIMSYFNFTIDDTFTILVIFAMFDLLVRVFIRISTRMKFSI